MRQNEGKDTGTVRLEDGGYVAVCDLPKKVDWDQKQMAQIEAQLHDMGEDPAEYIKISREVSESAYKNWPRAPRPGRR